MDVKVVKLLELIAKAKEIYACDYTDRTEEEYIAETLLDNGVTVQEWIPASEPPKVYRNEYGIPIPFLAYTEDKSPFITYFVDGKHWGRFGQDLKVTHWMPLPEPPKGE